MGSEESDLLRSMRNTVDKIAEKTQEVVGVNQHEAEDFSNSQILEEIEDDEKAIEHFQKNLKNLENELDQILSSYGSSAKLDEEHKEKLWNDIFKLSEEALNLAERYSQLPKDIGEMAIRNNDKEAANTSLIYFVKFGSILENTANLCEGEAEETVLDEIHGIERPGEKLKKEKRKLEEERKELEKRQRMMKQKLEKEGLID